MRQAIAVLLLVLLALPLATGALCLFAVSGWIADRGFYLGLAADERIYQGLLDERLPGALERAQRWVREPTGLALDGLPPRVLLPALRELVTPAWLRDQAVRLVNEAFDTLEGRRPPQRPSLDLTALKRSLAGEGGERFALALAGALPPCPAGEQAVLPGATLPRCRPDSQTVEAAAARIRASLPSLAARFPDRWPLDREAAVGWPERGGWWFAAPDRRPGRWLVAAGVALALLAGAGLAGAAFLAGRNRREILQWLGWPLAAPAALVLLIGLGLRLGAAGAGWWAGGWPGWGSWPDWSLAAVWIEVGRAALSTVSTGFLAAGGITLGLAAGLVAWGLSTPPEGGGA